MREGEKERVFISICLEQIMKKRSGLSEEEEHMARMCGI